jgi:plasmid stabilization system protein ParE
MLRIGEGQTALGPALQRLAELQGDEASRAYLRNIDTHLQRLLAENEQGRSRATADLRNDLRLLTRTVAALAEPQR